MRIEHRKLNLEHRKLRIEHRKLNIEQTNNEDESEFDCECKYKLKGKWSRVQIYLFIYQELLQLFISDIWWLMLSNHAFRSRSWWDVEQLSFRISLPTLGRGTPIMLVDELKHAETPKIQRQCLTMVPPDLYTFYTKIQSYFPQHTIPSPRLTYDRYNVCQQRQAIIQVHWKTLHSRTKSCL